MDLPGSEAFFSLCSLAACPQSHVTAWRSLKPAKGMGSFAAHQSRWRASQRHGRKMSLTRRSRKATWRTRWHPRPRMSKLGNHLASAIGRSCAPGVPRSNIKCLESPHFLINVDINSQTIKIFAHYPRHSTSPVSASSKSLTLEMQLHRGAANIRGHFIGLSVPSSRFAPYENAEP